MPEIAADDEQARLRELALRAQRGDADAFGALVGAHQTAVFNVCYRLLGERREAEDMTQETFVRAYAKLGTFDCARPFGPWIKRVAANHCLNHLERRAAPTVELDEDYVRASALAAASQAELDPALIQERREGRAVVRAALQSLPPHQRVAIELCHFQDMSYAEAAEALGLPVSDIKSHLFRARRALADRLKHLAPEMRKP